MLLRADADTTQEFIKGNSIITTVFNPPAIDLSITELLNIEPPKRARVLGIVVGITDREIMINDGDAQLTVFRTDISEVEVGKFYRFILNAIPGEELNYEVIAAHELKPAEVDQYRKVVGLERRIKRLW